MPLSCRRGNAIMIEGLIAARSVTERKGSCSGSGAYRHGLDDLGNALLLEGGQWLGEHVAQGGQVGGAQADAVGRQVAAAGHARVQLAQQPPLLPL